MKKDVHAFNERPWMKPGAEIAIIGFWKRENEDDPNSELKCYYYFNIANPRKREARRSEGENTLVNAKQVLYVSDVND